MKQAKVQVPFFINNDNMQYYLKGRMIKDLSEVHNILFKNGNCIFKPRSKSEKTEYPNISDTIVANAIRYIEGNTPMLEIELLDSLYYHKLREPCIKINGYAEIDEQGYIIITKVTRMTLADRDPIQESFL